MVSTLALRATKDGVIWPQRPLVSPKGLLSCVQNLPCSSHDKRATCFRTVTFNSTGDVLAVTDEKGRVFAFFVTSNRYALVQHLGVPTVACCFSPVRKTELLVTCENETIRCIDVQSQSLISTLRGHRFPAGCASFQKSGKLALTASQDAVILWDTKDWSRYRVLNAGPGVEEATFVSRGDLVAVCFQDDSIMMWELESLALRYRFSLPEAEQPAGLKKIIVSDDYKILVATGRSRFIYVWDFQSQTIIRIIELPPPIENVINHAFVPGSESLISILANDGSLFFLNVAAKKPKIKLEISNPGRKIIAFDIECHGRYLAACTEDGCMLLYDMDIARDTARRTYAFRKQQGLLELDENLLVRTRSGIKGEEEDRENAASHKHGERAFGPSGFHTNHPVSSKLIDGIFGSKAKRTKDMKIPGSPTGVDSIDDLDRSPSRTLDEPAQAKVPVNTGSVRHQYTTRTRNGITSQRKVTRSRSVLSSKQLTNEEVVVNRRRLESSLKCHGEYPSKYRVLVWRFLLHLPRNDGAFTALVAKGFHPAYIKLYERHPLQNSRLFRRLHRVLSAIAYWCPAFGEVSYLPALVYPFIKIFRENDIAAFEASLCVLLHWCRGFLTNLPYPPVYQLTWLENELEKLDPQLHDHFVQQNVNAEVYAWSLLQSIFTEVLSEDEWMCLWDHLFTQPDKPWLLQVGVLAYLSYFRTSLLAAHDRFSIEQFFHQQNAIKIQSFVQLLMKLSAKVDLTTSEGLETVDASSGQYWPLPKGQYPAFASYPKLIVDFQISERNRIALEEAELVQKKRMLTQVIHESEKLKSEHQKWLQQRQALLASEEKRRNDALIAERNRILSLKSLDHETRKRRLERLAELERAAQEALEESSRLFHAEQLRMDSELEMAKERTDFEISSRQQEEDLQRMEFETEKRVIDIQKQRAMDERLQHLRTEFVTRMKQNELQDLLTFEAWKREDEDQRRKIKSETERQEKLAVLQQERSVRQQLENKLLDHVATKEKELQQLRSQRASRLADARALEDLDREIAMREQELTSGVKPDTLIPSSKRNPKRSNEARPPPSFPNDGQGEKKTRDTSRLHMNTNKYAQSTSDESKAHDRASLRLSTRDDDGRVRRSETRPTPAHDHADPDFGSVQDQAEMASSIDASLDMLKRARRRLSSVVQQSRAESDSSSSSSASNFTGAALLRTQEDASLLTKALGDISSDGSSSGSVPGRRQRFQEISPISTLRASRQKTPGAPARRKTRRSPRALAPAATHNDTTIDRQGESIDGSSGGMHTQLDLPHQQEHYDQSHGGGDSSIGYDEDSSMLQRPIEELEEELGAKLLHQFSEEEKDDWDDSDDEALDDDRARLLLRAKKILQEQNVMAFDEALTNVRRGDASSDSDLDSESDGSDHRSSLNNS